MTKFEDNISPYLSFVEGAAPSSPAATNFKLYYDSADHLLKWKNSAGTVFPVSTGALTNPMTTKGDVIAGGASGVATRLAVGSDTQVLTADSAQTLGVKWATPSAGAAGALVFLEAHTASASASLDFTTFISSTYDEYQIDIVSLIPASNSQNLWMRMGTGGGPTYDTGNNYSFDQFVWRAGDHAVTGGTAQAQIKLDYIGGGDSINTGTAALAGVHGSFRLYDPQSASLYKTVSGRLVYYDIANFRVTNEFRGAYESTTAVTAIRFLMSSGNITSGTIRIYGVTKS